ncbi:MAG: hypothetical protein ACOZBL_04675 [Patescibacteria group bacterium]
MRNILKLFHTKSSTSCGEEKSGRVNLIIVFSISLNFSNVAKYSFQSLDTNTYFSQSNSLIQ